MTPLAILMIGIAATSLAAAGQHVLIAYRVPEWRPHLLFSMAAVFVAADAVLELILSRAASPVAYGRLFPLSALFICGYLIALVWIVVLRTGGARRWLAWLETGLLALTGVLDFALPHPQAYVRIEELRQLVLPWGEIMVRPAGPASAWRLVGDVANLGFLLFLLDTTVRLARGGRRRQAGLIGGVFVVSLSVLLIIPFDLGLLRLPPPHILGFLVVLVIMYVSLSDEVVKASVLSEEVAAGERRWRQLLDNARLLITTLDRSGLIVTANRGYLDLIGLPESEVVGRDFRDFVAPAEYANASAGLQEVLARGAVEEQFRTLMAKNGEERVVAWRALALSAPNGNAERVLSLGADITDRQQAEAARDQALEDLAQSVTELEMLRKRLEEENLYLRSEVSGNELHGIIGDSDALVYVQHKIQQVAPSDATVLLLGETGVGKSLFARKLHQGSKRRDSPFIAINCATLPPNLIESELFGHERGAFTGADRRHTGRFELADGGTLFLDEVGELPLELQPKLLRVLEEGAFERVGGTQTLHVNVRVVAATNRDLRQEIEAGRFREDLFYRLEVYPITVPPLRERREDVVPLVRHFVATLSRRHGIAVHEIPAGVLRELEEYDWPGNIRELQNVLERAVLSCGDGVLRLVDPLIPRESPSPSAQLGQRLVPLQELERDYISRVLRACDGQIAGSGGAAEILGLHPNTLRSRMKKLGLAHDHPS